MIQAWLPAALPIAVAFGLLIVPGLLVVWAGWGLRRIGPVLLIPAISAAIIGGSAVVAPWLGLRWMAGVPLGAAVVISALAFVIRRKQTIQAPATPGRTYAWAGAALAVAIVALFAQFVWAFTSPEAIAQRFDNIVHLNSVQYAVLTGNASPFHIGDTSDIAFYPNGWHALASLTAEVSGADIPIAVNAANLAVVALIWPCSTVALASAFFRDRVVALASSAVLSAGFGAFPALFFDWGVLYPNALGYSMLPAALAAFVRLLRSHSRLDGVREGLLFLLVAAGMTLGHPNALLALTLYAVTSGVGLLIVDSRAAGARLPWVRIITIVAVGGAVAAVLWTFARTGSDHAVWAPIQSIPQAIGAALAVSARGEAPTVVPLILMIVGLITIARAPRFVPIALPFIVATGLYVVVSGFSMEHPLRLFLTNPWYQDWNRLTALLPTAAIPVMTLGAIVIADAAGRMIERTPALRDGPLRIVGGVVAAVAVLAVTASVVTGPSVRHMLHGVRAAYSDGGYNILSADERALLDRLDEHVPADALILASPRTGGSLAYAFTGRDVTEMHIFGTRTADELLLQRELRDIDDNPEVCAALDRMGVDFVLDFGSYDVSGDDDPRGYAGMVDLPPSAHLVLRDAQGDARLFEIEGCSTR